MSSRKGKRVVVTARDIITGWRNGSCFSPLSFALRRAGFKRAIVQVAAFTHGVRVRKLVALPDVAVKWKREFDAGRRVAPFRFTVGGRS